MIDTATKLNTSHRRNEHLDMGDPNLWSQEERIACRLNCTVCRLIFRDNGEFRAAHGEFLEFADSAPHPRYATTSIRKATKVPASEKQAGWINKKFGEVEHNYTDADKADALADKSKASKMLDVLFAARRKPVAPRCDTPPPAEVTVQDGSYALRDADGVVKFYQVESPKKGNWVGWTFVSAQASDDLWPIKNQAEKTRILEAIAADPMAALALYGQELKVCGKCRRTLTDEASRARGIGPECYAKMS